MNLDNIKRALWQVSVAFVKNNNTMMGRFTYEDLIDDLCMATRRRHIIGDLQLFEYSSSHDNIDAIFQFSPDYLNREVDMLFAGMGEMKWKLVLSKAINRTGDKVLENDFAGIEEEIIEKISSSYVEIIHFKQEQEFTIEDFVESLREKDC